MARSRWIIIHIPENIGPVNRVATLVAAPIAQAKGVVARKEWVNAESDVVGEVEMVSAQGEVDGVAQASASCGGVSTRGSIVSNDPSEPRYGGEIEVGVHHTVA